MTKRRDRAFGAWFSQVGLPFLSGAADSELRVRDIGWGAREQTATGHISTGRTVTGRTVTGRTATGWTTTGRGTTGRRSVLALIRERRSGWVLRWAALASVVLHAAVLAAFLIVADRASRGVHDAIDATPMVELMMVEQKGKNPPAARAPPPPDQPARATPSAPPPLLAPREPQPAVARNPPPLPLPPPSAPEAQVEAALPPPAPSLPSSSSPARPVPAPPTTAPLAPPRPQFATREAAPLPPNQAKAPTPPTPTAPPAPVADAIPRVNLGGTDSLTNAIVKGDNVIPAGPDSKVHNREPVYPDEAVRRGQHGVVVLQIQVSPEGLPSMVDIERSSGFDMLDRSARDAVATWRFVPAVRDGQPIPSAMSLRVIFQLD
jgi:protein TonB